MHRFYISDVSLQKQITVENPEIHHQLVKVLRCKEGFTCIFFDGKTPVDYSYELKEIGKKHLIFSQVGKFDKKLNERTLSLYQWLPNKWEKIDYIVQKWVEVGISSFHFFRSQLAQKLFVNEGKIERIKKIAIEAVEQSGRNSIPQIQFYDDVDKMSFGKEQKVIFHHIPDTDVTRIEEVKFQDGVSIFVGPEGGWSEKEVDLFVSKWCQKVYFWEAILRCETVSSVVWFYIQHI